MKFSPQKDHEEKSSAFAEEYLKNVTIPSKLIAMQKK